MFGREKFKKIKPTGLSTSVNAPDCGCPQPQRINGNGRLKLLPTWAGPAASYFEISAFGFSNFGFSAGPHPREEGRILTLPPNGAGFRRSAGL